MKKYFRPVVSGIEKHCTFEVQKYMKLGQDMTLDPQGLFYDPLTYSVSHPREQLVMSCSGPTSDFCNGKGGTVVFSLHAKKRSIMFTTNGNGNHLVTATTSLLCFTEAKEFQNTLTTLYAEFVRSDNDWDRDTRIRVTDHYLSLLAFLEAIDSVPETHMYPETCNIIR